MSIIIGSCITKCSERERKWRQREHLIHLLEADEATVRGPAAKRRGDPDRMVKSFQRSAAGVRVDEKHSLRPPAVLLETTDYLLTSVLSRTDVSWPAVYGFCQDRLRAVRQDLTVQQTRSADALAVLRRCAVFHLYAHYHSRHCPEDVFDRHINTSQLHECLVGVLRLQAAQTLPSERQRACIQRSEAVHMLCSLPRAGDVPAPPHTRELRLAVAFRHAWLAGNFVRACRVAARLPPLLQLAVYRHMAPLRSRAIAVLSAAYRSQTLTVPAAAVADWLCYDDVTELICDVTRCGLTVTEGRIRFDRKLTPEEVELPDRGWSSLEDALKDPARLLAVCQQTDSKER